MLHASCSLGAWQTARLRLLCCRIEVPLCGQLLLLLPAARLGLETPQTAEPGSQRQASAVNMTHDRQATTSQHCPCRQKTHLGCANGSREGPGCPADCLAQQDNS